MVNARRFLGLPNENPIDHLDTFERFCSTVRRDGVSESAIKLTLFPFSLGDGALQWEKGVKSSLISTWDDCKKLFLTKFYPLQKTNRIRNEISRFEQGEGENLYEAWERMKGYTRGCPHHGFPKESILGTFHRGLQEKYYTALNTASNGDFSTLLVEQGEELIENLARSDARYCGTHEQLPKESKVEEKVKALEEKLDRLIELSSKSVMKVDTKRDGGHEVLGSYQEEVKYLQGRFNQPGNQQNHALNDQGYMVPPSSQHMGHFDNSTPLEQPLPTPPPPPKEEVITMLSQLLEGQTKTTLEMTRIQSRMDGIYEELQAKIGSLASQVEMSKHQEAIKDST